MPTDAVFSLGGVRIGFSGRVPPLSDGSFLPQFRAEGAPDVTLELYQDADAALDAPVIYEDSFYRVHRSGARVFAEVSAHGTLPTWGYSVLHCDERRPRLQILSPTCTCTLDQVLSGMMMESLLLARGRAILHAAVTETDGRALLFTGPSGVGKSTQAALWQAHCGAAVRNGDKALLRLADGQARVSGLPYAGTSGICERFDLPVGAIVTLRQAAQNRVERLSPAEAVKAILSQTALQPWNERDIQAALDLAAGLAARVPVFRLSGRPDAGAVACLERSLPWSTP